MDKYMLTLNLRARGVSEQDIRDAVVFGDVTVPGRRGLVDVQRRGNWYYIA